METILTKRKPSPLGSTEIEDIARRCSREAQKGAFSVEYSQHARDQMEDRVISENNVLQILEFGRHVEGQDRFDEDENSYSYLIRDRNVEDRDMAVSIAVSEENGEKVLIVTAMLIDPISGRHI